MIHHITRATRHLIFWSLIITALGITGVRLALSGVEGYKSRLAARVGVMVGAPVTIGRLGARMRGFSPEIVLNNIDIASVTARRGNAIELREIRLGINLLDVLIRRELLPSSWVTLVGAKLTVKRNAEGKLSIAGLRADGENPLWLLQTRRYEVLDSDITWQDEQRQGRPLIFKSADLALINEGEHHRVNALIQLPDKLGDSLKAALDLKGDLFGFKSLQGRAYLEGKNLNLPEWVTLDLPLAMTLASGRGDLKVWSDWRQNQSVSLAGEVSIEGLALQKPAAEPWSAEHLRSRFHWSRSENKWKLDIDAFELATRSRGESKTWPTAIFSLRGKGDAENPSRRLALYVERLEMQEAAMLARFLLPSRHRIAGFLRDAQLTGELRNFALFADTDKQTLSVNGQFSHAGIAPLQQFPGVENLSGWIHGSEAQGTIAIAGSDVVLNAPELFREPLPLKRLAGLGTWRQTPEGWSFDSASLELDARTFESKSRLHLLIPESLDDAFIDLQSAFSFADVSETRRFLPAKILPAEVADWLDQAFVKGKIPEGALLLQGRLADFPFVDGKGVFEVLFDAEQLELAYQPDWPKLTGMEAGIVFYQDGFSADVRRGMSHGLSIKQASVDIPTLNAAPKLSISGDAEGGIGQALEFIRHSPLSSKAEAFLQAAEAQGETQINLDLQIPLLASDKYQAAVMTHVQNAQLRLTSPDLPVRQITGSIKFDERGAYSDSLAAEVLDQPVKITLASGGQQTEIRAEGRIDIGDLRTQFEMPWLGFAEGETDYQLALRLPHLDGAPTLSIRSDLEGVRLELPDRLAKPVTRERPLALTFTLSDKQDLPLELTYGDDFSAALKFDLTQQQLESGHVLLGAGKARQRAEPGLMLEIDQRQLQLQDCLKLAGATTSMPGMKLDFRQIKVHGDRSLWRQTDMGRVDLDLQRAGAFWAGRIDSSVLQGRIRLPVDVQGTERIDLKLDRLDVSALTRFKSDRGQDGAAVYLPLLAVSSDKTLWNGSDLGRFAMNTERIPNGLLFNRFELLGKDQKLTLTGDWKVHGTQSKTQAQGRLELIKGGDLFARLGISKDLTETSGVVDFDLYWNAAPYRFDLGDLQGVADVNFKSGRILSIEPGVGRVLGILAMAQWFKRLQLDFSDVYQEGLTFNSIKGRFNLANGKAETESLIVDAVPAKITISGETDLINKTVDHIIMVAPKSAEAVPIAGTIMGKFAALIDKTITGTEHEGFFFGSQYLVKGSWENAEIRTLHEKEGLLQKTWSGFTEFPWLLKNNK
ncbi:MAG: YhdP family protein [Gammaproteobacteria bacterium]